MTRLAFKARGSDGRVAIYTGADDAPFDAPLSNMSRVLFHSDLAYPKIVEERTVPVSLGVRGAATEGQATYNLFAHGMAGTPLVFGYLVSGGNRIPLCGSFPVQMTARGWARWISLGATSTHVIIGEYWASQDNAGFAALSIDVVAHVTDTFF